MSHGVAVDVISAAVRPQVRAAHARCGDTDNRIGGLFQNRVGALFNAYISGVVHYDTTHVGLLCKTMCSVTTSRVYNNYAPIFSRAARACMPSRSRGYDCVMILLKMPSTARKS